MIIPSKITTAPDKFRATTTADFTGYELRDIFNPATPTSIYRISVIASSGGDNFSLSIIFRDLEDNSNRVVHKVVDDVGAFYSWDSIPIIVGPGQYIGIETFGLAGGEILLKGGDDSKKAKLAQMVSSNGLLNGGKKFGGSNITGTLEIIASSALVK